MPGTMPGYGYSGIKSQVSPLLSWASPVGKKDSKQAIIQTDAQRHKLKEGLLGKDYRAVM